MSTPVGKTAFLMPETPKPTPTREVDNVSKPQSPEDNTAPVDDADIISKLRIQNDVMIHNYVN